MKSSAAELRLQIEKWTDNRRGVSDLYEAIARGLLADEDFLEMLAQTHVSSLFCNRFFGAIHFLLLEGMTDELGEFYATVHDAPRNPIHVYPTFRTFCLRNLNAIVSIMVEREVQISDVRRSAVLLPAIFEACSGDDRRPLALVDVGACAGFNLNLDRYFYDYGVYGRVGDERSSVQLHCEVRPTGRFEIPLVMPAIGSKVGIDICPVDPTDGSACNWMTALVSPDDTARLQYLRAALLEARVSSPPVLTGTAGIVLPRVLADIDPAMNTCVMHAMTSHHFTPEEQSAVEDSFAEASLRRPLRVVSLEWALRAGQPDPTAPLVLAVATWTDGRVRRHILGHSDSRGVGAWLEWNGQSDA